MLNLITCLAISSGVTEGTKAYVSAASASYLTSSSIETWIHTARIGCLNLNKKVLMNFGCLKQVSLQIVLCR